LEPIFEIATWNSATVEIEFVRLLANFGFGRLMRGGELRFCFHQTGDFRASICGCSMASTLWLYLRQAFGVGFAVVRKLRRLRPSSPRILAKAAHLLSWRRWRAGNRGPNLPSSDCNAWVRPNQCPHNIPSRGGWFQNTRSAVRRSLTRNPRRRIIAVPNPQRRSITRSRPWRDERSRTPRASRLLQRPGNPLGYSYQTRCDAR
jgi:hypothetical protein